MTQVPLDDDNRIKVQTYVICVVHSALPLPLPLSVGKNMDYSSVEALFCAVLWVILQPKLY